MSLKTESILRVISEILWKKILVVANTTMFSHFIEEQHNTDKINAYAHIL